MGLTTSGTIGAQTALTLEDAAKKVQALAGAAKTVNPDILCLCHGGPIANPEDAQYILDNTEGIVGFYGASSIERFPTEVGIRKQTEAFKAITFKK
jgi:predicted TIM-barrel enzyme